MSRLAFLVFIVISFFSANAHVGPSGTLPVLYVDTEGGTEIVSTEDYVPGSYYLDAMGHDGVVSIGDANNPLPLQIRGRGNFTWTNFEKKPYRLKLDKKADLMGTGKSKHFSLLPHCDDYYGFLRNPVGFELSRRIGLAWTPGQQPVELVLNGEYWGLYFLTDQIKVAPNRVNIVEQEDEETDPVNITGGWLIEIDNYLEDGQIYVYDEQDPDKLRLLVTPHSPEVLSPEQYDYMWSLLSNVEKSLDKIPHHPHSSIDWEEYIDMDTLACFYIVNELMDNIEAFHGSCWMHKQRGDGTKLLFGPVWDFGSSFNRSVEQQDFIYNQPELRAYSSHWIDRIALSSRFQACVWQHYAAFRESKGTDIDQFVDDFYNEICKAVEHDLERWPSLGSSWLKADQDKFKEMLAAKVSFLDERWLKNVGVTKVALPDDSNVRVTDLTGRVFFYGPRHAMPRLEPRQYYILEQNGKATVIRAN